MLNQKFLASSVALVLSAQMVAPVFAAQFNDVSGHWAQQAINDLSQRGIISGYPNGTFKPEGDVTRAEFVSVLAKAKNLSTMNTTGATQFVDVPNTFWAYPSIEAASSLGLVSGYPGGYFRPYQNISRQEALAILANAAKVPFPNSTETTQILSTYPDSAQIPQWAKPGVAAAIRAGIFENYPNNSMVEGDHLATRADVAAMTERFTSVISQGNANVANNPNGSQNQNYNTSGNNTLQARVSTVPSNTIFGGILAQPISSDNNHLGDTLVVSLDRPLLNGEGQIVIPQGSQVTGTISDLVPSGRAGKNASITVNFTQVTTPDGKSFPLSAEINADNGALQAGTTKGRVVNAAGRTLGGAAIGGAAGALLGRVTGGKNRTNEGLLYGSLLGAGLGGVSTVASKGKSVDVQPGETIELRLRQPLTISQ